MSRLGDKAANTVNDVTVMFKDAALVFALPAGATLADLAERIGRVAMRHLGGPLSVAVRLRGGPAGLHCI
jgi:hypothetical protein